MRIVLGGLVASVAAGLAISIAAPAFAEPDVVAANAAMVAIVAKARAPGAGLAVADHGRLIDVKGFGLANAETHAPVGPDTMFALASCSKPITAMAVMKLVDDGKITLRTPAFAFLGRGGVADPRAGRITIEQLLNHSSGLPHDVAATTGDPMDTARAAARVRLRFAPGSQQAYSNAGFNVLGAVIEKASGRSYAEFVRDNVFRPAGVTRFGALESRSTIPGQAVRYAKDGRVVANRIGEGGTPAGGWVLSPADMVRVLIAYDAGKIVSLASRAAMLAPPVAPLKPRANGAAFGLGWDVVYHLANDPDAVFYGKNGGISGSSTWAEHRPDGIVFAAFYNGGNGTGAHRPGLAALEKALDGGAPP
ncbi:MAG TPA: serine hydrolase domain-containing protein [Candidatus Elarobacter sp.]|nr:serine hydrolase domain-containing protein [Candidatus Elarobacter sp.]